MARAIRNDRLEARFDEWDLDGDGRIERSDLDGAAHRVLRVFGESPHSPKGRRVLESFGRMYDHLAERAGVGPQGALDRQRFLQVVEAEVFQGGDAAFGRAVRPTVEAILDLADTDGDGEVGRAEFTRRPAEVDVDRSPAEWALRAIDHDRGGALTADELVAAVKGFHFGALDVYLRG